MHKVSSVSDPEKDRCIQSYHRKLFHDLNPSDYNGETYCYTVVYPLKPP